MVEITLIFKIYLLPGYSELLKSLAGFVRAYMGLKLCATRIFEIALKNCEGGASNPVVPEAELAEVAHAGGGSKNHQKIFFENKTCSLDQNTPLASIWAKSIE